VSGLLWTQGRKILLILLYGRQVFITIIAKALA